MEYHIKFIAICCLLFINIGFKVALKEKLNERSTSLREENFRSDLDIGRRKSRKKTRILTSMSDNKLTLQAGKQGNSILVL